MEDKNLEENEEIACEEHENEISDKFPSNLLLLCHLLEHEPNCPSAFSERYLDIAASAISSGYNPQENPFIPVTVNNWTQELDKVEYNIFSPINLINPSVTPGCFILR